MDYYPLGDTSRASHKYGTRSAGIARDGNIRLQLHPFSTPTTSNHANTRPVNITNMSYTYERYERSTRRNRDGRSTLGYWVPLGLTVAAATLTLAAWVWSERHEDDDDGRKDQAARVETSSSSSDDDEKKGRVQQELGEPGALGSGRDRGTDGLGAQDASGGFVARMSGAIRRTPSPQQILDEASRRVVAGVAAAGAVVEGALSSIREEEQHDFGDHNRWSEETDARELGRDVGATVASAGLASGSTDRARSGPGPEAGASTSLSAKAPQHRPKGRRKTVAVVVSSESAGEHGGDDSYHEEDAVSTVLGGLRFTLNGHSSQFYPTSQRISTTKLSNCSY